MVACTERSASVRIVNDLATWPAVAVSELRHGSGEGTAVQQEGWMTVLTGHDGGRAQDEYTGEDLAAEMFDLMRRRLPLLDGDDPVRLTLHALLPALGEALGRPRLLAVEPQRPDR